MKKLLLALTLALLLALTAATPALAAYDVWDGSVDSSFGGGSGVKDDPYLIKSAAQLAYLSAQLENANIANPSAGVYYRLESTIDLAGDEFDWTPIGGGHHPFAGYFDGNGYLINSLAIDVSRQDHFAIGEISAFGLFGVNNGEISNVLLHGSVYLEYRLNNAEISAGLICGVNNGQITDCEASGDVTVLIDGSKLIAQYGGGIAGRGRGTLEHCTHSGAVSVSAANAVSVAGGLIGLSEGSIQNCAHSGAVSSSGETFAYAGGLSGRINGGEARNSYAAGAVEAQAFRKAAAGGLSGYCDDSEFRRITLANCYYRGNGIIAAGDYGSYAGGLSGYIESANGLININHCYWQAALEYKALGGESAGTYTISECSAFSGTDTLLNTVSFSRYSGESLLAALNAWATFYSLDAWHASVKYNNGYPLLDFQLADYTDIDYIKLNIQPSFGGQLLVSDDSTVVMLVADSGFVLKEVFVDGVSQGAKTKLRFSKNGYYTIEADFVQQDASTWSNPYRDISAGDWYYSSVACMSRLKLMSGTATDRFSPQATLSRAMMATIVWRLAGSPFQSGSNFDDVAEGSYYYQAVLWSQRNGIVKGFDEATFAPDAAVTRQQLALFLYRYAQYLEKDVSDGTTELGVYTDAEQINDYARPAVSWAVNRGLLEGDGGRLYPQATATRAQVAAVLDRYLNNVL
ncbi:MAG: S-layer homology domain-containing protein [Bacillota bacterium]|nr:S-layer homology domain-containing protein [Bacillota bacterium]